MELYIDKMCTICFDLEIYQREHSFKVEIDRLHVHSCPLPSPHDFVGFVFCKIVAIE